MKRDLPRLGKPHHPIIDIEGNVGNYKDKMQEIQNDIFGSMTDQMRGFNEELDSEFFRIIRELGLPLDKQIIDEAGIVVERGETEIVKDDSRYPFTTMNYTATITQHGKPISRVISMDEDRIDSNCMTPELKDALIKGGALCPVLDDLKQMVSLESKTLQELLDEPERPDFNCTEIEVDPVTNKINRVVCLGKEYKS